MKTSFRNLVRTSIALKTLVDISLPSGEELTLEFEVLMAPGLDDQKIKIKVDSVEVGSRNLEHRVQFITQEEHMTSAKFCTPSIAIVFQVSVLLGL